MWSLGNPAAPGWNPSYGTARTLSAADFATLNASPTSGTAYSGNRTLWFHGGCMPMMRSGAMMSMTMLSRMSSAGYPSTSVSLTAQSGSYWYLCEYAGHAADGMYGSFVVG